ncbi:MAG TPA: MFS transporter [Chitinispirillaceae bacterium]|nr:MFS transporter [Chitinispirillaceae bacterium]
MTEWKKTFITIWSGQIFSTLSSMTVGYAVIFWLSIETKSAQVLATATIASLLPQLLLGPFIGVLVDRLDRRSVMIAADLFIAACTSMITVLLLNGSTELYWFYILLMFRSVGSAFHIPAMQASTPLLAPESELMRISGINQMIQSGSIIIGPPLAALLISSLNMAYVMLFDVFGAVIACISLLMVHIPNPEKKENAPVPHVLREIKEGLYEIYSRRGILFLVIVNIAFVFLIMPVATLFPLMTLNHFMGGTYHVSMVEVFWGAGSLIGGLILGLKRFNVNKIVLTNIMYIVTGFTFVFSGKLPENGFLMFMFLTLLGGVSMTIYTGVFMVILQTNIDPSALGRVFSIYGSISLLPSIFGLIYTGFVAERLGINNAFLIAGSVIALLGLCSFFLAPIREMIAKCKENQ